MKTFARNTLLSTALLALACPFIAAYAQAPNAKPMPSPPATATATLGGKSVTIKYNSPSMRGRKIMGDLVPYGQVWRTGANPATTLITEAPLKIGTLDLPAGTYTIYTLPAAPGTPWLLIINKQTGQWGTEYKPEMDLGRTPLTEKAVSPPQEAMSITFENVHGKSTDLHVRWADVDEWVKVSTP
jgi:hypothetical protein